MKQKEKKVKDYWGNKGHDKDCNCEKCKAEMTFLLGLDLQDKL